MWNAPRCGRGTARRPTRARRQRTRASSAMRATLIAIGSVVIGLTAGCARIAARPALNEVNQLVAERTSSPAIPFDDVASRRELDEHLAALLEEDLSVDAA